MSSANNTTEKPIYLDYNATTPVQAEVVAAMASYWTDNFFNPSSSYPEAVAARTAVEDGRAALAALLGTSPANIVFTSGGTESNNTALRGAWTYWHSTRRRIIVSAMEHPAVTETALALRSMGAEIVTIPTDAHGVIHMGAFKEALNNRTALVSVMLANNEIGTVQPVAEIARLAHSAGAWVHTDAAQAVGKISVNAEELGVDLLTVAGHKFYAPKGIGALYIRQGINLPTLLTGGGQERGFRSGTEPVPLIVGLGAASELAQTWLSSSGPVRQAALRDTMETRFLDTIPELRVFGRGVTRLPNTLGMAHPHWPGAALLAACPTIRAGTGSACHHSSDTGSPVLRAMGIAPALARGLVRLSLGRSTTPSELATAADSLIQAMQLARPKW
jgi:cysteine desulfurase